MATTNEKLIEVKWATHSDPSKVGEKEKLRPQDARSAVRTGMAQYVDAKDVPPARPSMNTRDEAIAAAKKNSKGAGGSHAVDAGETAESGAPAAAAKASGKN